MAQAEKLSGEGQVISASGDAADEGVQTVFPLVYYHHRFPGTEAMNRELEQLALRMEAEEGGKRRASMRGGYHSGSTIFTHDIPPVKQLGGLIQTGLREYLPEYWRSQTPAPIGDLVSLPMSMYGWVMVMRGGDMSAPHLHPDSQVSGVYYVRVPEVSGGIDEGQLVLMDPRARAVMSPLKGQPLATRVAPREGAMVLFPSWLEHYVAPFSGTGTRISIAFNIRLPMDEMGAGF